MLCWIIFNPRESHVYAIFYFWNWIWFRFCSFFLFNAKKFNYVRPLMLFNLFARIILAIPWVANKKYQIFSPHYLTGSVLMNSVLWLDYLCNLVWQRQQIGDKLKVAASFVCSVLAFLRSMLICKLHNC